MTRLKTRNVKDDHSVYVQSDYISSQKNENELMKDSKF